jgi:hypothetical protein
VEQKDQAIDHLTGGGGGIRTHETLLRPNGFQDRRFQPLTHPSKTESPSPNVNSRVVTLPSFECLQNTENIVNHLIVYKPKYSIKTRENRSNI